MRIAFLLFCIGFIPAVLQCDREFSTQPETRPMQGYRLNVKPTIGTRATSFQISVSFTSQFTDHEPLRTFQVEWESAGTRHQSEWRNLYESATIHVAEGGLHHIQFYLRGNSSTLYTAVDSFWVIEPYPLTENTSTYSQGNVDWCRSNPDQLAFDWRDANGEHKIFTASVSSGSNRQHTFDPDTGIVCHQFSVWAPDGRRIAYVNNSTDQVEIVDVTTHAIELLNIPCVWPLDWRPDGTELLVLNSDEDFSVWRYRFADSSYVKTIENCYAACYSPDGSRIAAVVRGYNSFHLKVFDTNTFQQRESHILSHQPAKLCWSPTGEWLCTDDGNWLRFINRSTGQRLSFFSPEFKVMWWPDFSPDGRTIAIEAAPPGEQTRIWALPLPEIISG